MGREAHAHAPSHEEFALDVLLGLSTHPKFINSRYFYDATGSVLFQKIMELPEYYPTRCETEILTAHAPALAQHMAGPSFNLVELGAGDGRKTKLLLSELARQEQPFVYVPIDVCEESVANLTESLAAELPGLQTQGVVAEYFHALRWIRSRGNARNIVLFMGSNIGNFNMAQAQVFLRTLWSALNPGDLVLIGLDLKKDIQVLLRAYNDRTGVTREFNLNLLARINRELGGDFAVSRFQHFGTYNVFTGAMESYILSLERQTVYIDKLNKSFQFEPYEPIHVEFSFKYLRTDIQALAAATGYTILENWADEQGWFMDSLWRVEKR